MCLFKTAATIATLATWVIATPVNNFNKALDPIASTDGSLNTTSVSQINIINGIEPPKSFGENFVKALMTLILTSPEAEYQEGTDIMNAPLILAINATINSIPSL